MYNKPVKQAVSAAISIRGCVVQELEKGLDGLLEQYRGIEQEEEVQSAAQTNSRTSKRNRQTLKGELPIEMVCDVALLTL